MNNLPPFLLLKQDMPIIMLLSKKIKSNIYNELKYVLPRILKAKKINKII